VTTILARENHGPPPLNPGDGAVPELHNAADLRIELREDVPRPGNVVGSIGVKDPTVAVAVLHRAEVVSDLLLLDVHHVVRSSGWDRGW
jgi:hypothetical protein